MSRATSTGSASGCLAAPGSNSSMMAPRSSRMLRRAFKFSQQQIVEVVARGFGHDEPNALAGSGPAVAAPRSGALPRSTDIVIDKDRESLHVLKDREIADPG